MNSFQTVAHPVPLRALITPSMHIFKYVGMVTVGVFKGYSGALEKGIRWVFEGIRWYSHESAFQERSGTTTCNL